MMRQKIISSLLFLWLTLLSTFAVAQQAPYPLPELQNISNQMLAELKKHEASMKKNPEVVYGIVRKILLPHVDITTMARSALGRAAWLNATPDEQQAFTDQFTLLTLRTYASGLSSYTDEKVVFDPIRGFDGGRSRVEVQSRIVRTDGPPIAVSYRLVYKDSQWLVYDFSVEGVSMIESFRSQFSADLSNGISVSALTQKIKDHNAKVAGEN